MQKNPRVLVPVANGSDEIELAAIVGTLRRAPIDVIVAVVGASKDLFVTTKGHVAIKANCKIEEVKDDIFQCIVLPGGLIGAETFRNDPTLMTMLEAQKAEGRLFGAICSTPYIVLFLSELIDAETVATCHPSYHDVLLVDKVQISHPVVVDGNCITAQGPNSAILFAVHIIALLCGEKEAETVSKPLLVDFP